MRLAPHTDGMNILPGRAAPAQTLPRAEVGGNPVSPYPCGRARPSRGRGRGATRLPHPPAQRLRPHLPSRGRGRGATRLPHPPAQRLRPHLPSRGRGDGGTRFPHVHIRRPCGCAAQRRNEHEFVLGRAQPFQTLPWVGAWGNPVSPCPLFKRQSVATKVTAPLPSPPPAGGRESGSSPQRGEVGRGAAAPHARR